ncbi:MAG: hypothetical protein ABL986_23685 [Vicinamibacterales bacterium]
MRGVGQQDGVIIGKYGLRFFERNPVLPLVQPRLSWIPFEAKFIHTEMYVSDTYNATVGI